MIDGDVMSAYGLEVSTPLRAVLEATTVGSAESSLVVANHFLHRGDFSKEEMQQRYDGSFDRWPFSLKTDLVIRLADPRIESPGESRTSYFMWKWHFPRPEPQYRVYDNGFLIARLDFAFPEHHVWVEFDGRIKYRRPPGGDDEEVINILLSEKRREERIAEITGWRCLRVTWADLAHPERLAARLRNLIESVARSRRMP